MKIRNKKTISIIIAVGIVLVSIGTVGALNGWFGGGAKISEDTMTRGLVGYWSFDEGNGTTTYDASENNNDGQFATVASSPKWASGKVSGALQFDGVNDYVDAGSGASLNFGASVDFTLEAWIKINAFNDSLWSRIVGKSSESATDRYSLGVGTSADKTLKLYIADIAVSGGTLTTGVWYHVVGVRNGSTGIMYIDGVQVNSGVGTPTAVGGTKNLLIGRKETALDYFNGLIDEVRIYNRALSAEEIRYHYNRGGPVAEWKFDEGNGTTTYDSTDNNNDGQFQTAASSPVWTTGKYGSALSFDGTNDYVQTGATVPFNVNNVYTAEAWIYPIASGDPRTFLSFGTGNPSHQYLDEWSLRNLVLCFSNESSSWVCHPGLLSLNTWYHAVLVRDGVNNNVKIYLNGVLGLNTSYTVDLLATTDVVTIGAVIHAPYTTYFPGSVDDVRIYNYARTADEIALDYNAGFAARFGLQSSCDNDPSSCMDQGLVGYWGLEEGNGTTTFDSSNYANNGQFQTAASSPKWSTGIKPLSGGVSGGGALQFDGKDDYVNCGTGTSLDITGAVAVEAWVKYQSGGTIVAKAYDDSNAHDTYWLYIAGGKVFFGVFSGTTSYYTPGGTTLSAGTWYHIVAVYIPSVGQYVYINGVLDNQKITGVPASINSNPTRKLMIGKMDAVTPYTYSSDTIDEVRIYNRALSVEEVRYHYNRGGPVAYWKFDEGNGTTTYDSTNNNNDGQFQTTASSPTWATGKYGSALSFDGVDDYVNIGTNNTLEATSKGLTVSLWANTTWNEGKETVTIRKASNYYMLKYANNTCGFYIYDTVGKVAAVNCSSLTGWHLMTGTFNGSNQVSFYLDGILVDSTTITTAILSGNKAGYIGAYDPTTDRWNGSIDDVRVYNYVRTPAQIQQDYNQGMAAHFGPVGEGVTTKDCDNDPSSCMDQGLVGYWGLEEGNGTTTFDSSNYANNGQFQTAASSPKWSTGIKPLSGGVSGGGALQFDGKDDYMNMGDVLDSTSGTMTIEAWIKINSWTDEHEVIVGKNAGLANTKGYEVFARSDTQKLWASFLDTVHNIDFSGNTVLSTGQWYYVVAVRNGTTGTLYLNGVQDGTQTTAGVSNDISNANSFNIGTINNGSSSFFNGLIDEVRIYNRALSVEEVRYHYNRGGPVAEWKFDEGEGTTTYDGMPNDNDGQFVTAVSSPAWATGKYGSALSFDGADDYVNAGSNTSLDLSSAISIEAWIKTSDTDGMIVSKGDGATSGYHLRVCFGNFTYYIGANSLVNTGKKVDDNVWHHTVITVDNSASPKVNVYQDGVKIYTGNETLNAADAYNVLIGKHYDSSIFLNGLIDDVRIYNYARTQAQILQDYNAGLSAHFK